MSSHTTLKVRNRAPWCMVPEALLEDQRLSHVAARLGAWLAGRPDDWEVVKWVVQQRLGLGETAWDNAIRGLKAAGYLQTTSRRVRGQWAGQEYTFDAMAGLPVAGSTERPNAPPEVDFPGTVDPPSDDPGAVNHPFSNKTVQSKQIKQTTTTPRARGAVDVDKSDVVVVSQEDQDQLVWPAGLAEDQLSSMRGILLGSSWPGLADAQALLDELAGQLPLGKVKNPAGLLRKLLKCQQEGTFTQEHGPGVREVREARRRHEAREAAAMAAPAPARQKTEKVECSGSSEVAMRERRKLAGLRGAHP